MQSSSGQSYLRENIPTAAYYTLLRICFMLFCSITDRFESLHHGHLDHVVLQTAPWRILILFSQNILLALSDVLRPQLPEILLCSDIHAHCKDKQWTWDSFPPATDSWRVQFCYGFHGILNGALGRTEKEEPKQQELNIILYNSKPALFHTQTVQNTYCFKILDR